VNRVWRAVVLTALILVVGGSVPTLSSPREPAASALAAARRAAAWLATGSERAPLALVGCLALWLLVRLARPVPARAPLRPRPRPARAPARAAPPRLRPVASPPGSLAQIARETGLAQDALRLLAASRHWTATLQGRNCRHGRNGRPEAAGPGEGGRAHPVATAAVERSRRLGPRPAYRLPSDSAV
jgi:hypothetical protein